MVDVSLSVHYMSVCVMCFVIDYVQYDQQNSDDKSCPTHL